MFPISCSCPKAQYRYDDLSGMGPGVRVGQPRGPWRAGYLSTLSGLASVEAQQERDRAALLAELPPDARKAVEQLFPKPGRLNEIVDNDPSVINARSAVEQAVFNFQSANPMTYTYIKQSARRLKSYKGTPMTATTQWDPKRNRWTGNPAQIEQLKRMVVTIRSAADRYINARKAVLNRLSNAIPYKGHVIKPEVSSNDVRYKVTFNISKKTGSFSSPEEAKAAIDNEVAFGPGGVEAAEAFEKRAEEVGEQQAAQEIITRQQQTAAQQTPQMSEGVQAPDEPSGGFLYRPPGGGLSTGAKVGIAAAAVGGAFLLMK